MLTPWVFFNAGPPLTVTNCRGRRVHYSGIEFEGSPREVFWHGFFEPCITDVIVEQIGRTIDDCKDHPELAEAALDEIADLLHLFVEKVYQRMAEIDQRIRGKGFPDRVQRKPVDREISTMNADVDRRIEAAKKLLFKPRPWWQRWWTFLLAALAIIASLIAFLGDIASIVSTGWLDWLADLIPFW